MYNVFLKIVKLPNTQQWRRQKIFIGVRSVAHVGHLYLMSVVCFAADDPRWIL